MRMTIISTILALLLISGAILLSGEKSDGGAISKENVSTANGKQIIEIDAKGGYSPRESFAKANVPTAIKILTRGTFDCSSALVIPSIGYRENLPLSGETLIEIPSQEKGSSLQGLCAMGMYSFSIRFD